MSRPVTFLPNPFVGEHLLSVVARWFILNVGKDFTQLKSLSPQAMMLTPKYVHHPMIDDVIKLYGVGVEREQLIANHTLLPYYAPLLPYADLHSILNQVKYQGCFHKHKRKIEQTSTPTTRYNTVLKYAETWRWCEQCVLEDTEHCGVAYWHTAHQLPSVLRCYKHKSIPLQSKCPSCGYSIKDLRLSPLPPRHHCPCCNSPLAPVTVKYSDELTWLENASFSILNQREALTSPHHKYTMQRGVQNFQAQINRKYGSRAIFVVDEIQQTFSTWLFAHGFDVFFHEPESAVKGKVLDLTVGGNQANRWPPLSVFLWLAFVGEAWPSFDVAA